MNLVVDIGSTASKAAIFFEGELINSFSGVSFEDIKHLGALIGMKHKIVSALGYKKEDLEPFLGQDFLFLSAQTPVPFQNAYETLLTLGTDRIALAAAAYTKYPNQNVLVIDAGTCITYEFIDQAGTYHGGAISPGIQMRYKALEHYTRTLPYIEEYHSTVDLIGKNTKDCMTSGVINGVKHEVSSIIRTYSENHNNLITVICGGDSNIFESIVKESIFVLPKFLLSGMNAILDYNVSEK